MMKSRLYLWDEDNKQVLVIPKNECLQAENLPGTRYILVDDYWDKDHPRHRYGSYAFNLHNEYFYGSWRSIDFSHFPEEFKAYLLLLGVE